MKSGERLRIEFHTIYQNFIFEIWMATNRLFVRATYNQHKFWQKFSFLVLKFDLSCQQSVDDLYDSK